MGMIGEAAAEPARSAPEATSGAGTVLLAASAAERATVARAIERLNYRVRTWSPDEALPEAGDGLPVAAVVCDGGPRALDACRRAAACCPVILVSDEVGLPARLAAVRAGVTGLVRRPVSPAALSEWLSHLAAARAPADVRVVIVDDDALSAAISAAVLRSAGMAVTVVTDPAGALEIIEETLPDVVLMDLQMPSIDGIELARAIRQSMHFVSLPIIFMSGERDEARQLAARRLGGDDFIVKPVTPARLLSVVGLRAERSRLLRSLIERDRLTGVFDQVRFRETLAHELERCRRTGGEIALAMIDIDHFKAVNDAHGHLVGDDVLRALADTLRAGLRRIDVVGRCGGEEFGILLLDTPLSAAERVIDGLRRRFSEVAFAAERGPFRVTFSAGVASSRDRAGVTALLGAADASLYRAKRDGRDRVRGDGGS